jgi:hypothetical protein
MPSRSSAPCRVRCITRASCACSASSWPCASARFRKSISSSGKSSVASTSMRRWISLSRKVAISSENSPDSERPRCGPRPPCWRRSGRPRPRPGPGRACRSEGALREFAGLGHASRAAAAGRSGGAPASRQRASSNCSTTVPPWACSSSTSSPVYCAARESAAPGPGRWLAGRIEERQDTWPHAAFSLRPHRALTTAETSGARHAHDAHRTAPRAQWRWRR